jgi:hypothetical protein
VKDRLLYYSDVQEIKDYSDQWKQNMNTRTISLEMGFYQETYAKLRKFEAIIGTLPISHERIGTILLETATLKKLLIEMPKQIQDSIRHNVTSTMDSEAKILKEELTKTSEILDQMPTSLNVYVEQVNTLKYIKEKQSDFDNKMKTINNLQNQCKSDNIKVGLSLQLLIEEVTTLYNSLPKLQEAAQDGLDKNKDTMEKIMKGSSSALSKKIKAFEKKYLENYL